MRCFSFFSSSSSFFFFFSLSLSLSLSLNLLTALSSPNCLQNADSGTTVCISGATHRASPSQPVVGDALFDHVHYFPPPSRFLPKPLPLFENTRGNRTRGGIEGGGERGRKRGRGGGRLGRERGGGGVHDTAILHSENGQTVISQYRKDRDVIALRSAIHLDAKLNLTAFFTSKAPSLFFSSFGLPIDFLSLIFTWCLLNSWNKLLWTASIKRRLTKTFPAGSY